jgi:hypothetical protein
MDLDWMDFWLSMERHYGWINIIQTNPWIGLDFSRFSIHGYGLDGFLKSPWIPTSSMDRKELLFAY